MPEFFGPLAWPLAAGLLLTALVDAAFATVSGRDVLQRPLRGWLVHASLLTLAFCLGLAVFQRPWIAACTMVVLQGVVITVSLVKKRSLNEPFVFQDIEYFLHAAPSAPFFRPPGRLALIRPAAAVLIAVVSGREWAATRPGWPPRRGWSRSPGSRCWCSGSPREPFAASRRAG